MQYQIGDRVVDPVYGVCTIKSIKRQRFAGNKAQPYYEVVTGGTTIWVPEVTQGATSLRAIVSKGSLAECRRLLLSDPVRLNESHKIRQAEISTRLKDGSLPARCAMVRDLRARSWSKPLGEAEHVLLTRISSAVCDEWAASEGIAAHTAHLEIESLLDKSRLAWKAGEGD